MATIMPHGVLFRGGKEKLIREIFINDDVIEAIISLPPGLFYGTGIPACVLVMNKNKPDALRGKVLFINADREYAEGKNQNKLRPEDIEKVDFVFTNKRELPKYSRLVDAKEIIETHDFNLNIRRYVDNTPDPEPEDVQAHLIGGVPGGGSGGTEARLCPVRRRHPPLLFQPERTGYLAFPSGDSRPFGDEGRHRSRRDPPEDHRRPSRRPGDPGGRVARDDFAQLCDGKSLPDVRHELITALKEKLVPLGVLDEFKSAGVFVNWWQQIRYDLKTIVSTGWHHTLIPDRYLIDAFFKGDADAIEALEASIAEAQGELAEAVETAQEVAAYEPKEDETVTAAVIKKSLKALIDDLTGTAGASAEKERATLQAQHDAVTAIGKRIRDGKSRTELANRRTRAQAGAEAARR